MHARRVLLLLLLLSAAVVDCALAGSGQVIALPLPRVKVRSGILLRVDTRWVAGNGYRPVRVRMGPIAGGAAPADRYFEVTVQAYGWHPGSKANAATATVYMAQGAAFGEAVLDIPQSGSWNSYEIETREDGELLQDLSTDHPISVGNYYHDFQDGIPSILVLHRLAPDWRLATRAPRYTGTSNSTLAIAPVPVRFAAGMSALPMLCPAVTPVNQPGMAQELSLLPDIRVLAGRFLFNSAIYGSNGLVTADRLVAKTPTSDAETMRLVNELPGLDMLPPSALPDRWLSLSGVDVVIASLSELERIAAEHPHKWEAINTWLTTGPTLCVHGVGEEYEQLPRLTRLLALPSDSPSAADPLHGWTRPERSHYRDGIRVLESVQGSAMLMRQQGTASPSTTSTEEPRAAEAIPSSASGNPPFVHRAVGPGRVVAIAAEDPFPGTEQFWSWIFNSVPPRNWLWYQRHGMSNQQDNEQFWNFIIPDIGRAPVLSFLALITLFALAVGPVNYFFLQRRGRLYLLLITVPAGALVVTGGLFLYATIADGLSVQARARSFTEIDQPRGRSTSWSRQTYYAGLAPSRGLEFPPEAAVYAIDHRPVNAFGARDTSRKVVWGDRQQLEGYFLSRTLSQLMVVEPRTTAAGLRVADAPEGESPRVTNELGITIEKLLLCDALGRHFVGADLQSGTSAMLGGADIAVESKAWRSILGAHRPQYPERFNPSQMENVTGVFGNPFRYGSYGMSRPTFDTSVMETALREAMATDFKGMRPRTYLALVPRPPFVSLGVDLADEVAGFHLIAGSW